MTSDRDPDDGRPQGLLGALLDLLAGIDEPGDTDHRGRRTSGPASIDYSVSVGGLDVSEGPGPGSGDRSTSNEGSQPTVTTRETEDGILVAADLREFSADEEDVSVDVDRDAGTLTLRARNEPVGEIPLEGEEWSVSDTSFTNGILEVHLDRE